MTQIIIYTNSNGGVSVCYPTGEIPIEEVLTKDCPTDAIIVDSSILPQNDDAKYFEAWVLNNGVVTVDDAKKAAIIAKEQEQITAKSTAVSKLTTLGLSEDEVKALIG